MVRKRDIEKLEERIRQLESERHQLTWDEFPANVGACFVRKKFTGNDLETRFLELYDYLGVNRTLSPEVTKLEKKKSAS